MLCQRAHWLWLSPRGSFFILLWIGVMAACTEAADSKLPNILWITSEDNGPQLGCYGDRYADTPNIDSIAARGMKYLNCWSNAPVCAPARTTLISGLWPNSTGSQNMRSLTKLPAGFDMYPVHLRKAGYYCTNNSKEDYNLEKPEELWHQSNNKAHWRGREANQPFFAVFNFQVSHESQIRTRPHEAVHDPARVRVPPFHPDLPEVRQDWAQYYDKMTEMDAQVGKVLQELKADGLEEETIVFFYGDHGTGMPRGKRWLYQTGLHVAMIVYVPEKYRSLVGKNYQPQSSNEELIGFIDMAPTVLSLAGIKPPEYYQGRAFLGPYAKEAPQYMYGFRDRMDERIDLSRAVRDHQFAYIRNFMPHRAQGQYLEYMFQTPTTRVWKAAFDAGKLNEVQSRFWQPKPPEELYDLKKDPDQIQNLAQDPAFKADLERMRGALESWMLDIRDVGLLTEAGMHAVRENDAPYTHGHDLSRYDVKRVYAAADRASRFELASVEALIKDLSDKDFAVRYWSTLGLLLRGLHGESVPLDPLIDRMNRDDMSVVRSCAGEAVARLGSADQRATAIDRLLKEASGGKQSTYEVIAALNNLAHSEPRSSELAGRLLLVKGAEKKSPQRVDGYAARLVDYLEGLENQNPKRK